MNKNKQHWVCKLWITISLLAGIATSPNHASAQITPDNTLGTENSIVKPLNPLTDRIDGGAIRRLNLFHSFQEFNIGEGRSAYFANPTGITNIFSRVTGSNPSHLFGTLGVLGNANLFFLNPNGIIFGPNAKLDMGGSFVASTANSVIFPDGKKFSANNPETPPLLTINVSAPVGLEFASEKPGAIVNGGDLGVGAEQNLTLAGGTVVSTGKLSTPGGELAVVTVPGIQADGSTPIVNIGQTGEFVNWEMRSQRPSQASQTSGSSQPATPGLTLSQLLANTEGVTGLTVNNAQVELTESSLPVQTGDVAVRELKAQTATLAAEHNLILLESKLGAKEDLNLLAKDTVRVRDSVANPVIAAAGNKLSLQGNQGVDIFALNHPQSGLFSGGDMVLRSADKVGGDAHYYAGGNFRIEKLDGSLGNLYSPHDPVIRSLGDVSFYAYEGASLHILAAGKVEIPGYIFITTPDTLANSINPTTTPEPANVTLSDGTALKIDGSQYLTVDIRAGIKPEAVGIAGIKGTSGTFYDSFFNLTSPTITPSPTSADIIIGDIYTDAVGGDGGRVFLTNQYESNTVLYGGISVNLIDPSDNFGGGFVTIDSRGGIKVNGEINVSSLFPPDNFLGNGGNATLLAKEDIILADYSSIRANGLLGGSITLTSKNDVSLTNGVNLLSISGGGGGIFINAHNLNILEGSTIAVGIPQSIGYSDSQVGDINLNATGKITISNSSILNAVDAGTIGQGGNINIQANSLFLHEGGQVLAETYSGGKGGNLSVNAPLVNLTGVNKDFPDAPSLLSTRTHADGNAGNLTINTRELIVRDGAQISSSTSGTGKGGDLLVNGNFINLSGANGNFPSLLSTRTYGDGDAGNLTINTKELILDNGGQISSSPFANSSGNGGNMIINAINLIKLTGNPVIEPPTGIFTNSENGSTGNAGNLSITISNGKLIIQNGAQIGSTSSNSGKGGNIFIDSSESVEAIGTTKDGYYPSGILTIASDIGDAGNLTIETKKLIVRDGAEISTFTRGQGKGGNLEITADDSVEVIGSRPSGLSGGLYADTEGSGDAGSLKISTKRLIISDGAQVSTGSRWPGFPFILSVTSLGKGGDLTINASESLEVIGKSVNGEFPSGLFTRTEGEKDAGNLQITTPRLLLQDEGRLSAETFGQGNAGNINITTQNVNLSDGAQISAFTTSIGDGGSITINSPEFINLGGNSELSVQTSSVGKAGNIKLTTNLLTVEETARITATATETATTQQQGGSITINSPSLNLFGKVGIFAQTQGEVPAGKLTIQPSNNQPNLDINFAQGAEISASTSGSGQGGSIFLTAPQSINIQGDGKVSVETTGKGNAGNINITTPNFRLSNDAQITASTSSSGQGGNINLFVDNDITLTDNNTAITASTLEGSSGNGGNIFIDPTTFTIANGAKVAVNSQGTGTGGDIEIYAGTLTLDDGTISSITKSTDGGNISLYLDRLLFMRNGSEISTTAGDKQFGGNGGNINIDAPFIVAFPRENSDITANAFQGRGGNIQISTQAIFGLEYQPRLTPNSDITASSEFGVDGQVVINTPGIDPSRGLTPLPDVPVNTQIVVGCQAGGTQSSVSFTDVGRTGLPARPDDPLTGETIIADWINPDFDSKNTSFKTTTMNLPKSAANSHKATFKTQLPTIISPCYAN